MGPIMCLVAVFFRTVPDAFLVVGANREEFYQRGGEPPQLLAGPCRAAAGIDPVAGGTWLGVNEHGVLVAVTNRAKSVVPAQPRSRGLLARELLACRTAVEAEEQATRELTTRRYAGCNFLCGDQKRLVVLHGGDWLRVRPLPPGIHVLSNSDVNQESDRRLTDACHWLGQRRYHTSEDCLLALRLLCASATAPPIVIHGEGRGTVSSSILALRPSLAESVYLHAQGSPDRTPYIDYSHLLRTLATPPPRE
jgi:uncharacterized protein with NRDE domain